MKLPNELLVPIVCVACLVLRLMIVARGSSHRSVPRCGRRGFGFFVGQVCLALMPLAVAVSFARAPSSVVEIGVPPMIESSTGSLPGPPLYTPEAIPPTIGFSRGIAAASNVPVPVRWCPHTVSPEPLHGAGFGFSPA